MSDRLWDRGRATSSASVVWSITAQVSCPRRFGAVGITGGAQVPAPWRRSPAPAYLISRRAIAAPSRRFAARLDRGTCLAARLAPVRERRTTSRASPSRSAPSPITRNPHRSRFDAAATPLASTVDARGRMRVAGLAALVAGVVQRAANRLDRERFCTRPGSASGRIRHHRRPEAIADGSRGTSEMASVTISARRCRRAPGGRRDARQMRARCDLADRRTQSASPRFARMNASTGASSSPSRRRSSTSSRSSAVVAQAQRVSAAFSPACGHRMAGLDPP